MRLRQRTILSVCDFPIAETRPFREYSDPTKPSQHTFKIEAAEKGKYNLLVITDMFQNEHLAQRRWVDTPVLAEAIANDLVNVWGVYGGVILLAGDEPTPEEVERASRGLAEFYEYHRGMAWDEWNSDRKKNVLNNPLYLRASRYLNHNDPWVMSADLAKLDTTICPYCTEEVLKGQMTCPKCQHVLDWEKFVAYEAEKEKALARIKAKMEEPAKPAPGPPPAAQPIHPPVKQPAAR